jgi:hypothetical protein
MAIVIQPFSQDVFNSLPTLEQAGSRFDRLDTKRIIDEELQPLFRKHAVEDLFGLQLLHQHFALHDGEYLTEINGNSTPMQLDNYQQLHAFPTVWKAEDENGNFVFRPLEYGVGTGNEEIDRASPYAEENISSVLDNFKGFFRDLHLALNARDLQGLFGLARHPGTEYPGRLEITLGRSNINLTPAQVSVIDSAWFLSAPD